MYAFMNVLFTCCYVRKLVNQHSESYCVNPAIIIAKIYSYVL